MRMHGRDAGSKYAVTRLRTSEHAKAGLKSFPMVYNMPIWSNIGLSYIVGKLLNSAFEQHKRHLRTFHVFSPGVPARWAHMHRYPSVCLSVCDLTKIQTGQKVTRPDFRLAKRALQVIT